MANTAPRAAKSRYFAVIPAAGRSARMGRPKLLLPWQQSTIIQHVLGQWVASRVSHVVMVVHPDDHELADVARRSGAHVVAPLVPPPDMKASVAHALAWITAHLRPQADDAWLLAPADVPHLSAGLIDFVIAADEPLARRILVPACDGKKGHPVLFPWSLASEVVGLAPDAGLNALVQRHGAHELAWPDPAAFSEAAAASKSSAR